MTTQPRQPKEILDDIFALDMHQCDLALCLASTYSAQSSGHIPIFRRINLSPSMVAMFRETIICVLEPFKKGTDKRDIALHEFSVDAVKPDNEIEYLSLSTYNSITQQIAPLAHYQDLPYFDDSEHSFIDGLRFHVVLIQPPTGQPVYFYRKYTQTQLLSKSSHFGMRLHEHLYDQVKEPTYLFDRHIDCMSCEDTMFILQKHNFYIIFKFLEELKKTAEQTLDILRLKDFIYRFDPFARACKEDKNKMLKLKNISMQPYLDRITIDDLQRNIERYGMKVPVVIIKGKKMVQYEADKPWAILHLLDDSYTDSPMTSESYYVKGKRNVRKK